MRPTGYFDDSGRPIRDGDLVRAIIQRQIIIGEVCEGERDWYVHNVKPGGWAPDIWHLDSVTILRRYRDDD